MAVTRRTNAPAPARTLNVPEGDRPTVAAQDQLAALVLRRYVTAVTYGRTHVQDGFDLFALEHFARLRLAAGRGVVFALGSQHYLYSGR